jgi:hypothetical protein
MAQFVTINQTATGVALNITKTGTAGSAITILQNNTDNTGNVVSITNSGSGADISGSAGNWTVGKDGSALFKGLFAFSPVTINVGSTTTALATPTSTYLILNKTDTTSSASIRNIGTTPEGTILIMRGGTGVNAPGNRINFTDLGNLRVSDTFSGGDGAYTSDLARSGSTIIFLSIGASGWVQLSVAKNGATL